MFSKKAPSTSFRRNPMPISNGNPVRPISQVSQPITQRPSPLKKPKANAELRKLDSAIPQVQEDESLWVEKLQHFHASELCNNKIISSAGSSSSDSGGGEFFYFLTTTQIHIHERRQLLQQHQSQHYTLHLPKDVVSSTIDFVILCETSADSSSSSEMEKNRMHLAPMLTACAVVVTQRGMIYYWDDVKSSWNLLPACLRIPLKEQENERIVSYSCQTTVSDDYSTKALDNVVFGTNIGRMWQLKRIDRKLKIRLIEHNSGILGGLTQSVSRLIFASNNSEESASSSIRCLKVYSSLSMANYDLLFAIKSHGLLQCWHLFHQNTYCELKYEISTKKYLVDALGVELTNISQFRVLHILSVTNSTLVILVQYAVQHKSSCFAILHLINSDNCSKMSVHKIFRLEDTNKSLHIEKNIDALINTKIYHCPTLPAIPGFEKRQEKTCIYIVWPKVHPVHVTGVTYNVDCSSFSYKSFFLQSKSSPQLNSTSFIGYGVQSYLDVGTEEKKLLNASCSEKKWKNCLLYLTAKCGDADKSKHRTTDDSQNHSLIELNRATTNCLNINLNEKNVPTPNDAVDDILKEEKKTLLLTNGGSIEEFKAILSQLFGEQNQDIRLRRSLDLKNSNCVAAILDMNESMVNAKPSTGFQWVTNSSSTISANSKGMKLTPQLTRFQLESKLQQHINFVSFLQSHHSFQHLEKNSINYYLLEKEEKIHAALALCNLQNSSSQNGSGGRLLFAAMARCVLNRGYNFKELEMAGYSRFDMFYCEVTQIDDILACMNVFVNQIEEIQHHHRISHAQGGDNDTVHILAKELSNEEVLLESNVCFYTILYSAIQFRQLKDVVERYHLLELGDTMDDQLFLPWTSSDSICKLLSDQISKTVKYLKSEGGRTTTQREKLYQQVMKLGSIFLGIYKNRIKSSETQKAYEVAKELVLVPLVGYVCENKDDKTKIWNEVVHMCENFHYFPGMVYTALFDSTAESTHNLLTKTLLPPLQRYCELYESVGFIRFLYQWYAGDVPNPWLSNQKDACVYTATLLSQPAKFANPHLQEFLKDHPILSKYYWIYGLETQDYKTSSSILIREAQKDSQRLSMKKTFVSIAKLTALASEPDQPKPCVKLPTPTISQLNEELFRINVQETLQAIPNAVGFDEALSSSQLVEACLMAMETEDDDDENFGRRIEFLLMALQVAEIEESNYKNEMVMKIWRCTLEVETNKWKEIVAEYTNAPNERQLQHLIEKTLFFRTIQLYNRKIGNDTSMSAALSPDLINEMIQELHDQDSMILNVKTRQLIVKALSLANAISG